MRLVSKIHDYYDGIVKSTQNDKTFTFVRNQKIETIDWVNLPTFSNSIDLQDKSYILYFEIVGFCGKIYPLIRFHNCKNYTNDKDIFAYSIEDVEKYFSLTEIEKNRNKRDGLLRVFSLNPSIKFINDWFENGRSRISWTDYIYLKHDKRLKNLFFEYDVAYYHISFGCGSYNLVLYPILKDLQFYKKYNIHYCFQLIEHFLTNELVKPDEINIEIDNEMKIQSHGFNKKSFRKEPEN